MAAIGPVRVSEQALRAARASKAEREQEPWLRALPELRVELD